MFRINDVVEFNGELYRILAIYPEEIVWIPIYGDSVFPSFVSKRELTNAFDEEILVRKPDPYEYLAYENPKVGSIAKTKQENNLVLIHPIISDQQTFSPNVRSARINQTIAEHATTKQTLYRLLRRYWQRGQTANALLPDFKNSGGKGKNRLSKGKKLGASKNTYAGCWGNT